MALRAPRREDRVALAVVAVMAAAAWVGMRPGGGPPRPVPPATPMTSGRDIDVAAGTPWPALPTPPGGPIRWPEQALAHAAAAFPTAATPGAAVVRLVNAGTAAALCDVAPSGPLTATVWLVGIAAAGLDEADIYGPFFGRPAAPPTAAPGRPTPIPPPTPTPAPVAGKHVVILADAGFIATSGPLWDPGATDPATGAPGCPTLAMLRALPTLGYGGDGCVIDGVVGGVGDAVEEAAGGTAEGP